jgi:hypothetical protein
MGRPKLFAQRHAVTTYVSTEHLERQRLAAGLVPMSKWARHVLLGAAAEAEAAAPSLAPAARHRRAAAAKPGGRGRPRRRPRLARPAREDG